MPPVRPSTEQRLRELESLKERNLVAPEEYQSQRRRILEEL